MCQNVIGHNWELAALCTRLICLSPDREGGEKIATQLAYDWYYLLNPEIAYVSFKPAASYQYLHNYSLTSTKWNYVTFPLTAAMIDVVELDLKPKFMEDLGAILMFITSF